MRVEKDLECWQEENEKKKGGGGEGIFHVCGWEVPSKVAP